MKNYMRSMLIATVLLAAAATDPNPGPDAAEVSARVAGAYFRNFNASSRMQIVENYGPSIVRTAGARARSAAAAARPDVVCRARRVGRFSPHPPRRPRFAAPAASAAVRRTRRAARGSPRPLVTHSHLPLRSPRPRRRTRPCTARQPALGSRSGCRSLTRCWTRRRTRPAGTPTTRS